MDQWKIRHKSSVEDYQEAQSIFWHTKKTWDAMLIAKAEKSFNKFKKKKGRLEIFKKDLDGYVWFMRTCPRSFRMTISCRHARIGTKTLEDFAGPRSLFSHQHELILHRAASTYIWRDQ